MPPRSPRDAAGPEATPDPAAPAAAAANGAVPPGDAQAGDARSGGAPSADAPATSAGPESAQPGGAQSGAQTGAQSARAAAEAGAGPATGAGAAAGAGFGPGPAADAEPDAGPDAAPDPAPDPARERLLDAILPHVPFDGWSPAAWTAAVADAGLRPDHAATICPRGATDLAVAFHRRGDAAMERAIRSADLTGMKFRDKVAFALRARIAAIEDKEAVRRGTALFALPHLAAEGARLIWGTADRIWTALGDRSDDVNWYTKRATLAGVYGATVLYWLGDDSLGAQATDAFIDRRIDDVMRIEKVKATVNGNPLLRPLTGPLNRLFGMVKAPSRGPAPDLPGRWSSPD